MLSTSSEKPPESEPRPSHHKPVFLRVYAAPINTPQAGCEPLTRQRAR
jgi:hypothetical protein